MSVEVFSDFVCPWCYIGHARIMAAQATIPTPNQQPIVWRSFRLEPDTTRQAGITAAELMLDWVSSPEEVEARLASVAVAAAAAGLTIDLRRALPVNTMDAHRLSHFAANSGAQATVHDGIYRAYHADGQDISDRATLTRIASEAGLYAGEVRKVLESDAFRDAVLADATRATRIGIRSVPSLVTERGQVGSVNHPGLEQLLSA